MNCVKCKEETKILQDNDLIYRWMNHNISYNYDNPPIVNWCNNCELAFYEGGFCKMIVQMFNTSDINNNFRNEFCTFTIVYGDISGKDPNYKNKFIIRYFGEVQKSCDIDYIDNLSEYEIYSLAMRYVDNLIFK